MPYLSVTVGLVKSKYMPSVKSKRHWDAPSSATSRVPFSPKSSPMFLKAWFQLACRPSPQVAKGCAMANSCDQSVPSSPLKRLVVLFLILSMICMGETPMYIR